MLNHSGNPQLAVAGMTEGAPPPLSRPCSCKALLSTLHHGGREREREWSPTRIVTHVVRLGKCAMAKIHGEIHGEILVCFWWGIECHACHHSGRILVSPTVVRYIDLRFSCFTVFWYILTMYCMYWQAWLIALVTVVPDLILHYPPPSLLRGSHEV